MADAILLIDDDAAILRSLGAFFETRGWDTYRELTGEAGVETAERVQPDVVLLDLRLPGIDGLEVLDRLRGADAAIIIMSGDGDIASAVEAMRLGAETFLVKPMDLPLLQATVERAAEKVKLRRLNRTLVGQGGSDLEAIGTSPAMRELRRQLPLLARTDRTAILVTGEPGTGKRTIARLLHDLSPRAESPCLETGAGTDDPAALEATLFGIEAGHDGTVAREGLVELADGGSLIITQIGEAPLAVQGELSRMLESRAIRRRGGTREIPVDIRLIATCSVCLSDAVAAGSFREDLWYRLNVLPLVIPPLRDRSREDILALLKRTVREFAPGLPGAPTRFSEEALERLLNHAWPGNLREMRNLVERALLVSRGVEQIGIEHLPGEFRARPGPFDRRHTPLTMDEVERMHIERTLKFHAGNRTRAAEELGISRATLIAKIKKYAIPH
jgi:two-component system, NtrC family, nitrogen regulation response regulator NtrX